jgi:hypothetical protein
MASGVTVYLTKGALASNVFWQVAGQVTLGTGAHLEGAILGQTAIVLQTGASLNGWILSQTAVTLDANTVVIPASATSPLPSPSPSPSSSPSP